MWRKPGIWLALLGILLIAVGATIRFQNPKNISQKAQNIIAEAEANVARINALLAEKEDFLFEANPDDFVRY